MAGVAGDGYADLGRVLGGGQAPASAYAEAQGENLGANTENAIAQAQERFTKAAAKKRLHTSLAVLPGMNAPGVANAYGDAIEADVNPEQLAMSTDRNIIAGNRVKLADVNTSPEQAAASLQAVDPQSHGNIAMGPLGDVFTDVRNPGAGVQLSGKGVAAQGKTQAETALIQEETKNHPHIGGYPPMGMGPGGFQDPVTQTEYNDLVHAGVIDPEHVTRAMLMPGVIHATHGAVFNGQAPGQVGGTPGAAPVADPTLAGGTLHSQVATSERDLANMGATHAGGRIRAGSALVNHLGLLRHAADLADANDLPGLQQLATSIGAQAGSDIKTQAALLSQFVGGEMDTFLANGKGTGEGRANAAHNFNMADMGGQQLRTNASLGRDLIGGQADALRQGYNAIPVNRTPFEQRWPIMGDVLAEYDKNHPSPASPHPAGTVPPPDATAPALAPGAHKPGVLHNGVAPKTPNPAAAGAAPAVGLDDYLKGKGY